MKALPSSFLSKSRVLVGAVVASVFALLTSCGNQSEISATGDNPGKESTVGETIVLYSWSEYFSEDLLAEFTERTGISIDYQEFDNTDKLQEILKSSPGRYDVVVIDDVTIRSLVDARLVRELDLSRLPNFSNIDVRYLTEETGKDGNKSFGVPYLWGTTLVAYRTDKLEDPDNSWNLIFNRTKEGEAIVLGERIECYPAALYALGLDPNSQNRDDLTEVTNLLSDVASKGTIRFGSDDDVMDAMVDGTATVAMLYSGDAALLADEEHPVDFFIPREGAMLWTDNFVIPRDSEKSDAAYEFINFMLEADSAVASSEEVWYATPNKLALDLLDPELREDERIFPPKEVLDRCQFIHSWNENTERLVNNGWTRVQRAYLKKETASEPVARTTESVEVAD
ncbi:MAG: spermidine/putrescine ABC transporter substrate-binding protein [Verrucomicrobiota bacterium]